MQKLRRLHLYLGCFFAPIIIFFATTGVLMEFGNERYGKWFHYFFAIHMGQMRKQDVHYGSSIILQGFVVLMGLSLITTVIAGIILAFKYGRSKLTIACLSAGFLIPLAMILIFGK